MGVVEAKQFVEERIKALEEKVEAIKKDIEERVNQAKEELKKQYEEQVKQVEEQGKLLLETQTANIQLWLNIYKKAKEILEKIEKGELPKEAIQEILCAKNIAFCCGENKNCPARNLALMVLDIPLEEYFEIKKRFGELMVKDWRKVKEYISSLQL